MTTIQKFQESFYGEIKSWIKTNNILKQEVPVIRSKWKEFFWNGLQPIARQILFNDLYVSLNGSLTDEGLKMLIKIK